MKHRTLILVIAMSPVWADDHASPASTPTAGYRSVFVDYKPMPDETVQDWRQANDQMGWLRGHMGHFDAESPRPGEVHQHPEAGNETTPDERR
jgi:hypothetical protein